MASRSIAEAASELRREWGVRKRCYGRWVQDGKLTEVEAIDRLERLEAALDIVERAALLASIPVDAPNRAEAVASASQVTSSGDKPSTAQVV